MRTALLLASLLLTAGLALAVAPASSAASCSGTVDVSCESSWCTIYAFNGARPYCVYGESGYCTVYTSVAFGEVSTNALTCVPDN